MVIPNDSRHHPNHKMSQSEESMDPSCEEVHQHVAKKLKKRTSKFGCDEVQCKSMSVLISLYLPQTDTITQFHPHVRKFCNKPFKEWYDLKLIFGMKATGNSAMYLSQRVSRQHLEKQTNKPAKSDNDKPISPGPTNRFPHK
ncbi:hypothetical protein VP01_496g17 [Puccinia sorghi]|uniref:Uncharacterized protein n=1 Tax=Puccinia sorghi TaxID=27349 RepID=A0A0L6ULV8_9BASI|nr:hypothetical protein VP01_496g17 [Puccinia sorghi]